MWCITNSKKWTPLVTGSRVTTLQKFARSSAGYHTALPSSSRNLRSGLLLQSQTPMSTSRCLSASNQACSSSAVICFLLLLLITPSPSTSSSSETSAPSSAPRLLATSVTADSWTAWSAWPAGPSSTPSPGSPAMPPGPDLGSPAAALSAPELPSSVPSCPVGPFFTRPPGATLAPQPGQNFAFAGRRSLHSGQQFARSSASASSRSALSLASRLASSRLASFCFSSFFRASSFRAKTTLCSSNLKISARAASPATSSADQASKTPARSATVHPKNATTTLLAQRTRSSLNGSAPLGGSGPKYSRQT
mmetsp:Transcript_86534/g.185393  ORF Transcript_86534/g.185393 Transcript_86534/m.185393 type:complete len:307 (+) Transcript_86534:504-1424(+)